MAFILHSPVWPTLKSSKRSDGATVQDFELVQLAARLHLTRYAPLDEDDDCSYP